jgi:outer membrane protein TolC
LQSLWNYRALILQLLRQFMVLSGLTFQRAFLGAVFTILFSATAVCLQAAEAENVAGTMPEDYLPELKAILVGAFKRSPELIAREFERVVQEARVTMTKASRLPQVGGNFDYGITQTATASNTSSQSRNTGAQYSFSVGQALFHWGALKNEVEIARINLEVSNKDTERMYREVSLALRKAYMALIVEKARVRHAREALELVRADVAVAQARKQDGTLSGAVVAGEEMREREVALGVERAEVEFAANRRRFALVAGMREIPEDSIPGEIPKPTFPEPLAAAIAAETLRENARSTLEYEIYELRLREALLRQKIVNTRLLPKFGVGASYSLRNNTEVNGILVNQQAVTEQRVAVSGSWNIFDSFATSGAKREAAANRRSLEQRKISDIDALLQRVQTLERTLKLDSRQIALADTRHAIAVEGGKLVAEGVSLGNLPKADVERAEIGILQAYASSMEARAAFLNRWTEFVATAGADPILNDLSDRNVRK